MIAVSVIFVSCIVFASTSTPSIKMPPESLSISLINPENISLSDGYYNVSVTLVDTGAVPTLMQKFFVYPMPTSVVSITNKTIPDMTVYFNRTAQNPNQLNYALQDSDSLQVTCLIPEAGYASNTTMSLTIYTSQAIYCTGFNI